jgi:hypothetical protein
MNMQNLIQVNKIMDKIKKKLNVKIYACIVTKIVIVMNLFNKTINLFIVRMQMKIF